MPSSGRIEQDLSALNRAYVNKRLRILVGAGASTRANFPSWDALDLSLLNSFLRRDLEQSDTKALQLLLPLLPGISKTIYEKLSREAIDLVWDKSDRNDFFRMMGEALYGGRSIDELPVPTLHRQIASMEEATIFTTNYDPLLELAMCRVREGVRPNDQNYPWKKYLGSIVGSQTGGYKSNKGFHIHGFVEPNGDHQGNCVLTSGHYFQLARNQQLTPNKILLNALEDDGVLLILGMSLNDPNLRRLLYEGRTSDVVNRTIYAILKEDEPLVATYQEMHWKDRGVNLIWVEDYSSIESLLRQVKFNPYVKGNPPSWAKRSIAFLSSRGFPEKVFTDSWQLRAEAVLRKLREQIMLLFPPVFGEELGLNFLIPVMDEVPKLVLACRIQHPAVSGSEARKRAFIHSFEIGFLTEEGSSGAVFVAGQPDSTEDDELLAHRNIDRAKKKSWTTAEGFRDWRSILSIPICDSADWLPVCVLSITSNHWEPFWTRFGDKRNIYLGQLKAVVRGAVL
jgi:hypothetical protein